MATTALLTEDVPLDDDAILQLIERGEGEAAPEPGTLKRGDVTYRGGGDADDAPQGEAQQAVSYLQSAGYRYIYDTRTGERSMTNNNMLPTQLKKRRDDGSVVFTIHRPAMAPKRGTHLCLLHTDRRREEAEKLGMEAGAFDEMGLTTCRKANLVNEFQVRRHMQTRHKVEWAAIDDARKEQREDEERAFRKTVMEQAMRSRGGRPPKQQAEED